VERSASPASKIAQTETPNILPNAVPKLILLPENWWTDVFDNKAKYSTIDFSSFGQLSATKTTIALPSRNALQTDLYPRVNLPDLVTNWIFVLTESPAFAFNAYNEVVRE